MSDLAEFVVILTAIVLAVPLARRCRLGAVIGYLIAGVVIGPSGLGLIRDHEAILHIGELGVVLLLFLIGLELKPSRLWALRRPVFGLGGVQVLATGAVATLALRLLDYPPAGALVAGLALSLSSTAFVLQLLAEQGELGSRHGRDAFAVLLLQDVAVIPMLALLPLLATEARPGDEGDGLRQAAVAVAAITVAVLASRYLVPRLFRLIAASRSHEVATAGALLVVAAAALGCAEIGLSMSLGAFLIGLLLADSEFRHELEANIEPFKGVLLGLFFIAVGMSANLGLLAEAPLRLLGLTLGLMALKAGLMFGVACAWGHAAASAGRVAVLLAQGGEFAFVLFANAAGLGLLDAARVEELSVVVTLSMALTPLLLAALQAGEHWLAARRPRPPGPPLPPISPAPVLIAGYGRFGQTLARFLHVRHVPYTLFDTDVARIELGRQLGETVHYGDASRVELLRAAHAAHAAVLVIGIDDVETSLRAAATAHRHFPQLRVLSRACNARHTLRLMDLGVQAVASDTYLSALEMAECVGVALGDAPAAIRAEVERFREHDQRNLRRLHGLHHDERRMLAAARAAVLEMEAVFGGRERRPPAGRDD
ncbi:MAG: cation:proton antiporter [Proteobacteria bacterium]|nr:cation:proton antiporter [Pseudomonadota bacterium]